MYHVDEVYQHQPIILAQEWFGKIPNHSKAKTRHILIKTPQVQMHACMQNSVHTKQLHATRNVAMREPPFPGLLPFLIFPNSHQIRIFCPTVISIFKHPNPPTKKSLPHFSPRKNLEKWGGMGGNGRNRGKWGDMGEKRPCNRCNLVGARRQLIVQAPLPTSYSCTLNARGGNQWKLIYASGESCH